MAAANGDLIQCVDNQTYLGQQVLNVYYYRVIALLGFDGDYLSQINDAFTTTVLDKVTVIQADSLQHLSREWRNLSNGTDLFVDSSVVPGDVSVPDSELTPSFTSLGFLLQRESLTTRNGYKRLAGIPEGNISGNEWISSMVPLNAIAEGFASDLSLGGFPAVEPIIVKRPIVVPVESYLYSSIGSASFRGVGTQNTRKKGRGV